MSSQLKPGDVLLLFPSPGDPVYGHCLLLKRFPVVFPLETMIPLPCSMLPVTPHFGGECGLWQCSTNSRCAEVQRGLVAEDLLRSQT